MIQGYLLETLFIFRLPANMCLGIFVEIFLSASPGKQNISDQGTNSLILSHMPYTVHLEIYVIGDIGWLRTATNNNVQVQLHSYSNPIEVAATFNGGKS